MKRFMAISLLLLGGCSNGSSVSDELETRIIDLEEQNEVLISENEEIRSDLDEAIDDLEEIDCSLKMRNHV